jgi:hypothetical protein
MRVVVDTSAFIALDRIGQVDLLRQLFGSVDGFGPAVDEALRLLDAAGFRMSAELAAAFRRL